MPSDVVDLSAIVISMVIGTYLFLKPASGQIKRLGLLCWRRLTRSIREGSVVTVDSHIQQSLTERRITISIWNRSDQPVVVDSWTVHIPARYLLPGIKNVIDTDHAKARRYRRLLLGPRLIANRWVRRFSERARIAGGNRMAEGLAQATLGKLDFKHQLLDPGVTVVIGPKEREVRSFPKPGGLQGLPSLGDDIETLEIIPSCRIVGQQRRYWGMASALSIVGGILISAQAYNSNRHS